MGRVLVVSVHMLNTADLALNNLQIVHFFLVLVLFIFLYLSPVHQQHTKNKINVDMLHLVCRR